MRILFTMNGHQKSKIVASIKFLSSLKFYIFDVKNTTLKINIKYKYAAYVFGVI